MWRFYTLLILCSFAMENVRCVFPFDTGNIPIYRITNGNRGASDINIPVLSISSLERRDSGTCTIVMTISGKDVKDEFRQPCAGNTPRKINADGFSMVGNPNEHSICLYMEDNTNHKVTIVKNVGCSVRSYITNNGVTTYNESPMEEAACSAIRTKMVNMVERNRENMDYMQLPMIMRKLKGFENPGLLQKPPPGTPLLESGNVPSSTPTNIMDTGNEGDVSSPTLIIRSRFLETPQIPKPCKQEITAVGNGVKDAFTEPCTQNGADSINGNGIVVYGDPKKLPFCLFSDKPNTLIVVKNKLCTIKTYKTINGETTSTKSPMSIGKCSEIKKRMSDALKSRPNNPQQQPNQPVNPPQAFAQPLVFSAPPITLTTPASLLQQIHPMFSQPTQMPLSPQPITSPGVSNPPTTVSNPVKITGSVEPTVTYRPADSRISSPFYSKTFNSYNNNGRRTRDLLIVGRGVYEYLQDYSKDRDSPKSVSINNMLAMRDSTGDFGLFTDTWGEMWVFDKDQCSKRTYETPKGQIKITSTPMSAAECAVVKDKLTKLMGGEVANNGGGGEQNIGENNNLNINVNAQELSDLEKDFNERMANWQRQFQQRMARF